MRHVSMAELSAMTEAMSDGQLRVLLEFMEMFAQLDEPAREVIGLTVAANSSDTVRRAMEAQLFLSELLTEIEKVAAARREREN